MLPWEASDGAPAAGIGICLSGGGVRAAAFALGAVQALQARRQLLVGPRCADVLVGVSGGSYVGAAATLNAADWASRAAEPDDLPPLAVGSPEARHIVTHGEYLLGRQDVDGRRLPREHWRNYLKLCALGFVNAAALPVVFIWVGTILGIVSWIADAKIGELTGHRPSELTGAALWGAGVVAVIGLVVTFRGLYYDAPVLKTLVRAAGLVLLLLTGSALVTAVDRVEWLSEWSWWLWWPLGCAVAVVAVPALLWWRIPKVSSLGARQRARATAGITVLSAWTLRATGAVLFCLTLSSTYTPVVGVLTGASTQGGSALTVVAAGAVVAWVTSRASLHRWNRSRIASAFAVRRDGDRACVLPATGVSLSDLKPPERGTWRSYPRLLISATANVKHVDARGAKRRFAAFVFDYDRCGVPGVPYASYPTTQLERGRVASGWPPHRDPMVSLMTAVACTGAAVSPAMGRFTAPALRTVCVLANLRLGTWLPNPLSARTRAYVASRRSSWRPGWFFRGFGGGYDEFLPELFGLHRSDVPRAYVSDGGHFDNLGLLTALRARCQEIWCVDSEADRDGAAEQLGDVISLAQAALGVTVTMDLAPFAGKDGVLGVTHAVGSIQYPGSETPEGTLVVIKLGMSAGPAHAALRAYQRDMSPAFPFHATFKRVAFDPDLMEAYRALGYLNASAAVDQYVNEGRGPDVGDAERSQDGTQPRRAQSG